jgi:small subunit ribosomal protein S18
MSSERSERPERAEGGKRPFFKRKKTCPFSGPNAPKIDWKDIRLLGRYVSERGKIVPSRITAVSVTKQRDLAQAIKRARFMAIMPYVGSTGQDSFRPRGDRPDRGDRPERSERPDRAERSAERQ